MFKSTNTIYPESLADSKKTLDSLTYKWRVMTLVPEKKAQSKEWIKLVRYANIVLDLYQKELDFRICFYEDLCEDYQESTFLNKLFYLPAMFKSKRLIRDSKLMVVEIKTWMKDRKIPLGKEEVINEQNR